MKFLSIAGGAYRINPAQIVAVEEKDGYYTVTMITGQDFDVDEEEEIAALEALMAGN